MASDQEKKSVYNALQEFWQAQTDDVILMKGMSGYKTLGCVVLGGKTLQNHAFRCLILRILFFFNSTGGECLEKLLRLRLNKDNSLFIQILQDT